MITSGVRNLARVVTSCCAAGAKYISVTAFLHTIFVCDEFMKYTTACDQSFEEYKTSLSKNSFCVNTRERVYIAAKYPTSMSRS